ncbi:helix-turn-helix transcriptional regulator [Mycobacterium sp. 21AC1]|uniref:helix-turn-helix domain-containing protein n=1 Tax=[Mycobacterium] appelbergii TaxID=2939269 RepID=UPI002938E3AD|nr:helix-turn-helix transcriptional regulator [Mycobacterium sp. 21AC1]MDV3130259.1 helix-turn-helix transcriptional regulator [Mycobacterium sp. 21AC1]
MTAIDRQSTFREPPRAWLVTAFSTAPVLDHADWDTHAPHRVIVCPNTNQLRPTQTDGVDPTHLQFADVWVIPTEQREIALRHGPIAEYCEIDLPDQLYNSASQTPLIGPRQPLTLHLIERIHQLARRRDATARLLTQSLTDSLRLQLIDGFASQTEVGAPANRALDHSDQMLLLRYIDQLGAEHNTSVAALAARVGMPVGAFTRAFAETFHTTPHQFVLDRRISRAKTLLTTTSRSITEISAALGFSTHSHFSTAFKKRVGTTPARYRSDAAEP